MGYHENDTNVDADDSILTELERHKRDLIYKIGLRCISILNYLVDHADSLPTSATRRMVVTHDIPWLLTDLLNFRPWTRKTKKGIEKYIGEKWILVKGEAVAKVVKHEAQAWFCLRQILFNCNLMQSYEINEEKQKQLAKVSIINLLYIKKNLTNSFSLTVSRSSTRIAFRSIASFN